MKVIQARDAAPPANYPMDWVLWPRDDSAYGDTVAFDFVANYGIDPGNSTFTSILWLYNFTDGGIVALTATTGQTLNASTANVIFGAGGNPAGSDWDDGDTYRLGLSMACPADYGRASTLYNAWMRATITDLTKAKVHWRVTKRVTGTTEQKSRIYFDPTLYPSGSKFFLDGQFYCKNTPRGREAVVLCDIVGSDVRYLTGAFPDCEIYADSTFPLVSRVTSDLWPPGSARSFDAMMYTLAPSGSNAWSCYDVNLIVQFPGPSPVDKTATFEVPIEISDQCYTESTSTITYPATKVAIDTAEYDGEVTYYVETCVSVYTNPPSYVGKIAIVDDTGTELASKEIHRYGVQRFKFVPNAGLDYYRIKVYGTTTGDQFIYIFRIVISQKNTDAHPLTKTRVYVPLLAGNITEQIASTVSLIYQNSSTTFSTTDQATLFMKDDVAYDQQASGNPTRFEICAIASSSTASTVAEIYNNTDGADVPASYVTMTGTTPTYVKADFPALDDLKLYQLRIKRSGGAAGQYAQIQAARVSIALNPFNKGEVYWRLNQCYPGVATANSLRSLAYIDNRAYNGLLNYRREATAYSNNTFTCTVDVWDQSAETLDSTVSLTFGGAYNRKRSGSFALPSSGYCWLGNYLTRNSAAQRECQSFVVLYPVKAAEPLPPIKRRPDFWPMFLGDLDGQEPNFGPAPRKPICT
jgi:hypothetical protein